MMGRLRTDNIVQRGADGCIPWRGRREIGNEGRRREKEGAVLGNAILISIVHIPGIWIEARSRKMENLPLPSIIRICPIIQLVVRAPSCELACGRKREREGTRKGEGTLRGGTAIHATAANSRRAAPARHNPSGESVGKKRSNFSRLFDDGWR